MSEKYLVNKMSEIYQSPILLDRLLPDILYSQSNNDFFEDDLEILSQFKEIDNKFIVTNDVYLLRAGLKYKLTEYHFHQPAEHVINRNRYSLEMHCVLKTQNSILVIAYLIKVHHFTSPILKKIIQNQPFRLPALIQYFTYTGSLTTPPFNINVNWIVSDNILNITEDDFSTIITIAKTARPLQNHHGRNISYITSLCPDRY